jgi:protein-S-isoprenylcysteine O-methyltransferase Ste14
MKESIKEFSGGQKSTQEPDGSGSLTPNRHASGGDGGGNRHASGGDGLSHAANMRARVHGHIHGDRADLAEEHPLGELGQLVLALVFLAIWAADSFLLRWTLMLQAYIPWFVSVPVGAAIAALAVYLALKAHTIVFGEVRETPAVIDKGVFGLVRHPMYLGSVLFFLALAVATLSLAAMGFLVVVFIFYNHIAAFEENVLIEKYGNAYRDYRRRVGRWFPRPGK